MINISGNTMDYWLDAGEENNSNFLFVNCCGYQKLITKNINISRDKGRKDFLLIYIANGRGHYHFGRKTVKVEAGNVLFYVPNQPQHYEYYFKEATELYWVHFTGYDANKILLELSLLKNQIHNIGVDNEYIELFKKLIFELQVKNSLHSYHASAYLLELLSTISRKLTSTNVDRIVPISSDIEHAISFMHSNYNKNYSINDLARECNLSLYRFIHKFKSNTGMSPVEYITKIRIDEATHLLSYFTLSISDIASVVGYENPLYFSRVFKKTTGMSPSEYRVSARKK